MPKSFLIDTSRCTACRGCQIACKEWHELPANKTKQRGSHQNPPDLNPFNYKLVRFSESLENGKISWYFFPDQCRHCIEPPCKGEAEGYLEGAIIKDDKTGAVLFTELTAKLSPENCEAVRAACPYDIPRRNEQTGLLTKCTMCIDRVSNGMLPACVKVCPTGAMNFGERADMLELAQKRLAEAKKTFPKATLADADNVSTIYLLIDEPKKYQPHAVAGLSGDLSRKQFLARIFGPLKRPLQRTASV
ncbi:MAG: formate dehydrogenase [Syntrophobacteraceae bacterium CG2_30_61_12]|nr:MAG: formate dehydrogenase [Syntrophobacteraceae bacterium CG2_30_61_12]